MYCSWVFMCCFGDFVLFCLDSDVPGESEFAGEDFEEFQGQQGKSHRSQTTLWACWSYLKLCFYSTIASIFECHWVELTYSLLWPFCTWLLYSLIPWAIIIWLVELYIMVQLDVRYNCLAMLRDISSLMG